MNSPIKYRKKNFTFSLSVRHLVDTTPYNQLALRSRRLFEICTLQTAEMKATIFWIFFTFSVLIMEMRCCPVNQRMSRDSPVPISYNELVDLRAECSPIDTCNKTEGNSVWNETSCDCDSSCANFDTCCIDSEFRVHTISQKPIVNQTCVPIYGTQHAVFMVDTCKDEETSEDLCFADPEESNDPFLIIPVTSNATGITYKNYYCAVCNQDVNLDHLIFWDIKVFGNDTLLKNLDRPKFMYDKSLKNWTVSERKNDGISTPVPVTLQVNQSVKASVRYCSSGLIENCASNWTDTTVEEKCKAYMAKITIYRDETDIKYRNPHCALCNFEDLETMNCLAISPGRGSLVFTPDTPLVYLFKPASKRCPDPMIHDTFADKCRCNSKLYRQEGQKCVKKN